MDTETSSMILILSFAIKKKEKSEYLLTLVQYVFPVEHYYDCFKYRIFYIQTKNSEHTSRWWFLSLQKKEFSTFCFGADSMSIDDLLRILSDFFLLNSKKVEVELSSSVYFFLIY